MYTDIQSTVTPRVEFHQGIPSDLEDDEFFDPKLNNLLILDDLQSTSGKDKRITEHNFLQKDHITDHCPSYLSTRTYMLAKIQHREETVII